jgi:predicted nucleotidyltransferase
VGTTWEALKRAERDRTEAGARAQAEQIAHLERLAQDISAARVSVHALEDRIELELNALRDELPQNIAKLAELSANRARIAHEDLRGEIAALADASWRLGRRWNAVAALIGFAVLVQLLRC